jgi:mannitol-1-/sugar-/sorbitol-6-phosphatase
LYIPTLNLAAVFWGRHGSGVFRQNCVIIEKPGAEYGFLGYEKRCSNKGIVLSLKYNALECEAVLFDLDGVLIDSSQCITRHWKEWADRHGLDLNLIMQVAHGLRSIDTMRLMAPRGLDVEEEARQYDAQEVRDHAGVTAIEGAHQVLAALPEDAWAVVTSGSTQLARGRMAYVGLPIPRVLVTADDVQQGKPAPGPYLLGAKRLGAAVEECVVIEDAPAGIQAGKRAGMRVIGIAATHAREALLETGANIVIDRLADLIICKTANDRRLTIQIV